MENGYPSPPPLTLRFVRNGIGERRRIGTKRKWEFELWRRIGVKVLEVGDKVGFS
jgi:hypothetical protein